MTFYLSFDIGGTYIKFGVVNEQGDILQSGKVHTELNKYAFIDCIVKLKEKYSQLYDLQGVAFSMPGFVNIETGYLKTAGSIKYLYEFNFKKTLTEKLSLPVELDNDVNCIALAEKWLGNAQASKNFLCLSIGTGIGGAIFLNDQLVRGNHFMAGEFGYTLLQNIFTSDNKHVTLSDQASVERGLIMRYQQLNSNLIDEHIDGEDIYNLATQGDKVAKQTIDEFYQSLAMGLYNLTFMLNPEKILIGGAISQRNEIYPAILKKFQAILNYQSDLQKLSVEQLVTIESCKFNNNAGLIGAVYHFITMTKHHRNCIKS